MFPVHNVVATMPVLVTHAALSQAAARWGLKAGRPVTQKAVTWRRLVFA
jgi:hypothetical protein